MTEETFCKWTDNEEFYETECKKQFFFNTDGIKENGFIFCPFCGAKIKEEIELQNEFIRVDEKPTFAPKQ